MCAKGRAIGHFYWEKLSHFPSRSQKPSRTEVNFILNIVQGLLYSCRKTQHFHFNNFPIPLEWQTMTLYIDISHYVHMLCGFRIISICLLYIRRQNTLFHIFWYSWPGLAWPSTTITGEAKQAKAVSEKETYFPVQFQIWHKKGYIFPDYKFWKEF